MNAERDKVKTLVVDDDPDLLAMISAGFKAFGFEVVTATNGEEAWEVAQEETPDVIVSDIRMPGGDGFQLLDRIKAENPREPAVILITGFSDKALDEMFHLGADGVMQKPFSAKKIKETIIRKALKPVQRWGIRCESEVAMEHSLSIENIHEALHEGALRVGRGGIFFELSQKFPVVGDRVSFNVEIKDGYPCANLRGIGVVQWVRKTASGGLKSGIGLELEYLDQCCLEDYTKWLRTNRILSYIPKH